jgi:hypothetical protein
VLTIPVVPEGHEYEEFFFGTKALHVQVPAKTLLELPHAIARVIAPEEKILNRFTLTVWLTSLMRAQKLSYIRNRKHKTMTCVQQRPFLISDWSVCLGPFCSHVEHGGY